MKRKIAIDIDDTTVDFTTPFLNFYNHKYGTHFKKKDCPAHNLETVLGISIEQLEEKELPEFYESKYFKNIKPIAYAQEALKIIKKENEISIVTFRPTDLKEKTGIYFKEFFTNSYSSIIYSRECNKTKSEICAEKNFSLLIDDHPDTALECSQNGIPVILFNQPWNEEVDSKNNLIIRGKDWKEILKII